MTVIQPTRQCFDDAVELLLDIVKAGEPTDGVFIVHALIESNEPGQEGEIISHGWLEYRDFVFFRGLLRGEAIDLAAPRREYYRDTKGQGIDPVHTMGSFGEQQSTLRHDRPMVRSIHPAHPARKRTT